MPTFALNFSRPGAQVVAQYYTFLRLGRDGYRAVQQTSRDVARSLAERIEALGDFRLLTRGDELPVFAFTTAHDVTAYDVFDVSRRLRERGWLVPAYTFPANREDLSVLRVVCRNGFSAGPRRLFLEDLKRCCPNCANSRTRCSARRTSRRLPPLGRVTSGTPVRPAPERPRRRVPRTPLPTPARTRPHAVAAETVSPATACGPGRSQRTQPPVDLRLLLPERGQRTPASSRGATLPPRPSSSHGPEQDPGVLSREPPYRQREEHREQGHGQTRASQRARTPPPGCRTGPAPRVAVADIGFHSATAPSQPGMDSGEAKALERKPTGQTRICTACTSSGLPGDQRQIDADPQHREPQQEQQPDRGQRVGRRRRASASPSRARRRS